MLPIFLVQVNRSAFYVTSHLFKFYYQQILCKICHVVTKAKHEVIIMLLHFFFLFFLICTQKLCLKRYRPYVPHQNVGNPRYYLSPLPTMPPRDYFSVFQKLIILKESHVIPHFKENCILNHNHNQVVKSI